MEFLFVIFFCGNYSCEMYSYGKFRWNKFEREKFLSFHAFFSSQKIFFMMKIFIMPKIFFDSENFFDAENIFRCRKLFPMHYNLFPWRKYFWFSIMWKFFPCLATFSLFEISSHTEEVPSMWKFLDEKKIQYDKISLYTKIFFMYKQNFSHGKYSTNYKYYRWKKLQWKKYEWKNLHVKINLH